MLHALWFIFRLAIVIAGVIWLAERPGDIVITTADYVVETSVGFMVAMVIILMMASALLYRAWRAFVSMPSYVRRYRQAKARENGYEAVTKGLVAVAAGDATGASRQANRAKALLPETALTRLLVAQAALMNGDDAAAHLEFENLLEDKNAAFFGVRGLLNEALKNGDQEKALELMRHAENLQPKRGWILQNLFENETKMHQWDKAEQTLAKAVRTGVISREIGRSHRQAILLARSDEALGKDIVYDALTLAKKAYNLDPSFVPAAGRLAKLYALTNKAKAGIKVIEKTWPLNPHYGLAEIWVALKPKQTGWGKKLPEDAWAYEWMKRLVNLRSDHQISQAVLGKAAMQAKDFETAHDALRTAGAYRELAELERVVNENEAQARHWLEMAADAERDPEWVCDSCGHTTQRWHPLCQNCHGFNHYEWQVPSGSMHKPAFMSAMDTGFIEPPIVEQAAS